MMHCGMSEDALMTLVLEVDEAWRRCRDAPQGRTTATIATSDNLQVIWNTLHDAGINAINLNGVVVECCFGECGNPQCQGVVQMRIMPTVLTSGNFKREKIDALDPKKD